MILIPIIVTLPMVSLSFPMYWNIANYVALGRITFFVTIILFIYFLRFKMILCSSQSDERLLVF